MREAGERAGGSRRPSIAGDAASFRAMQAPHKTVPGRRVRCCSVATAQTRGLAAAAGYGNGCDFSRAATAPPMSQTACLSAALWPGHCTRGRPIPGDRPSAAQFCIRHVQPIPAIPNPTERIQQQTCRRVRDASIAAARCPADPANGSLCNAAVGAVPSHWRRGQRRPCPGHAEDRVTKAERPPSG